MNKEEIWQKAAVERGRELYRALRDAQGWLNCSDVQYVISHKMGEQAALQMCLKLVRTAIRLAERDGV